MHVLAPRGHAHLDRREDAHRVDDRSAPAGGQAAARPANEDIIGDSAPLRSAADLAHTEIFDDGEVEEFITDLYAMRRSDVA